MDVNGSVVCGVNNNSKIFCKSNDTSVHNWSEQVGSLKHISVGTDSQLYGVNSANEIYVGQFSSVSTNPNFSNISGILDQVDVNGSVVCGVSSQKEIFCKSNSATVQNWTKQIGALSHISVGSNNTLFGVNSLGEVYKGTYSATSDNPNWEKMASPIM